MKWWEKSMNYFLDKNQKLTALHLQKFKKKKLLLEQETKQKHKLR
jgi:hypothetical protein